MGRIPSRPRKRPIVLTVFLLAAAVCSGGLATTDGGISDVNTSAWGAPVEGLQCRATAPRIIEQAMHLNVEMELRAVPQQLPEGIRHLNSFLHEGYCTLLLWNPETGEQFSVPPVTMFSYYRTGGPILDEGRSAVALDGRPIEPLKVKFPLRCLGERPALGLYECRVQYSVAAGRNQWWHWTQDWDRFDFWHGTITSGPFSLRMIEETPKTVEFIAPRQVHYNPHNAWIGYTEADAAAIRLPVRNGYSLETRLCSSKGDECFSYQGGIPNTPESRTHLDFFPIRKGDAFTFTMRIVERPDPPSPPFQPLGTRYSEKVLWERVFTVQHRENPANCELAINYLPPWLPRMQPQRRIAHKGEDIHGFAITADGRTIATNDNRGTLRFWEVESGRDYLELALDKYRATRRDTVFSPDGRIVVARQKDTFTSVDATTGKPIAAVSNEGRSFMTFCPDGRLLVMGGRKALFLDPATLEQIDSFPLATEAYQAAFSPDGKTLAIPTSESICLIDTATREEVARLKCDHSPSSVVFSSNGRLLAVADWWHVRLWDVPRRRITGSLQIDHVPDLLFFRDGSVLAAAEDGGSAVILYSMESFEPFVVLDTHDALVHGLTLLSDNRTLVVPASESIAFWDLGDLLANAPTNQKPAATKTDSAGQFRLTASIRQPGTIESFTWLHVELSNNGREVQIGRNEDSRNCTIGLLDSKGQPCPLTNLGKEVAAAEGIELLLFSLSELQERPYHGWVDLARYFQMTPGRYRASVTVDLTGDGHPAKITAKGLEFTLDLPIRN